MPESGYTFLAPQGVWQAYHGGMPVSVPELSQFFWVNQVGSQVSASNGPFTITQPPSGGGDIGSCAMTGLGKNVFTITAGLSYVSLEDANVGFGLVVRDLSTGNCAGCQVALVAGQSPTYTRDNIQAVHFTQGASGPLTYVASMAVCYPLPLGIFLRIVSDGTNISYWVGSSPFDFVEIYSEPYGTFVSNPSQVGIFLNNNANTWPLLVRLFHWEVK